MAISAMAFSARLLACLVLFELGFAHPPLHVAPGYQGAPGYDGSSLNQCLNNMTQECGIKIFQNIFHRGPEITDACCGVLLKFGHPCHSELLLTLLSTGKFASHEVQILQKSTAAWKRCRSIVGGQ